MKLDRRVRKTRTQLRDALVDLTLKRGWDEVSVLDVCEHADVGRSTFYLHFADKEDLLLSGFDELHEGLAATAGAPGTFAFVAPLFEHASQNTKIMRAVAGRKSGQSVQKRFRDVTLELIEAELVALSIGAEVRPHLARYLSGALIELMVGWLEAPASANAASLATLFARLTEGAVSAARRR
jgi:AcrR family transcriptional regulator